MRYIVKWKRLQQIIIASSHEDAASRFVIDRLFQYGEVVSQVHVSLEAPDDPWRFYQVGLEVRLIEK